MVEQFWKGRDKLAIITRSQSKYQPEAPLNLCKAISSLRRFVRSFPVVAIMYGLSGFQPHVAAEVIGFGAGQPGSQNYETNRAIAALLKRRSIPVRLESYGGASTSLALLNKGELDFTAVVSSDLYDAVTGRGTFEGSPLSDLRIVTKLVTTRAGVFVSDQSDMQSSSDLAGKKIAYGYSSQPSLTTIVDGVLASAGLGVADVQTELVASVLDGADRLAARRIDAAMIALGAGKLIEIDALLGGVRLLPVGRESAALKSASPTAVVEIVSPGPGAIGVSVPTPVLAYHYVVVTRSEMVDNTVSDTLDILWANVEELRSDSYVLSALTRSQMGTEDTWGIMVHPAAMRFFIER